MPNRDGFHTLAEVAWPCTYIYRLSVPWGYARMELTVNIPGLEGEVDWTRLMALDIWMHAIAPAMSFQVVTLQSSCFLWKLGIAAAGPSLMYSGQNGIFPASRDHSPVAILLPQRTDYRGRTRLYFPAVPRGWIDELGQLNHDGAGAMRTHLHGMLGGLLGTVENAPCQWWNYVVDGDTDPLTGLPRVGFTPVEYVRLCSYTARYPDFVP